MAPCLDALVFCLFVYLYINIYSASSEIVNQVILYKIDILCAEPQMLLQEFVALKPKRRGGNWGGDLTPPHPTNL